MSQLIEYDTLRDLSRNKVNFVCMLKVLRKWYEPENQKFPRRLHIVVRDLDGNRVQGTVDSNLIDDFAGLLRVGTIYKFNRFSAVDSQYDFVPSRIPFSILFLKTTSVERADHQAFPDSLYSFTPIPLIKNGLHWDGISMFDVIGLVVDTKYYNADQEGNQFIVLLLEDKEKNQIKCVLTGECYTEFHIFLEAFWTDEENMVVMLQCCGCVILNGDKVLKSVAHITNVLLSQDLKEIAEFKRGLISNVPMWKPHGEGLKQYDLNNARNDFLSKNNNYESIAVLKRSYKGGFVWVFGTIQEIMWDQGWFSTKCRHCGVDESVSKVYCVVCKGYIGDNACYRITVRIVDGESSVKLLFLNDTANYLIGKDARSVIQEQVHDANRYRKMDPFLYDTHSLKYPSVIKELLGTDHLFKVQIEDRDPLNHWNVVFTCNKVCSDVELTEGYEINDGSYTPFVRSNNTDGNNATGTSTKITLRKRRYRTKERVSDQSCTS